MPADTPHGFSYPLYTDSISTTQAALQDMAEDMDTAVQELQDRLDAAKVRPSCKLSAVANQAVAANTNVTATWATENFDNAGMGDIAVSNTRIRMSEQGLYMMGASLVLTAAAGTYGVSASFALTAGFGGGIQTLRGVSSTLDTSPDRTMLNPLSVIYIDGVSVADVTVVVRQNSAGSINIQERNFWVSKVSNLIGAF